MREKKEISFILQYIKKPRTVGAILPSSRYLANKMMENIDLLFFWIWLSNVVVLRIAIKVVRK